MLPSARACNLCRLQRTAFASPGSPVSWSRDNSTRNAAHLRSLNGATCGPHTQCSLTPGSSQGLSRVRGWRETSNRRVFLGGGISGARTFQFLPCSARALTKASLSKVFHLPWLPCCACWNVEAGRVSEKRDVWHTLMSVWIAPPKENIAVARQYTGKQPRNSEFSCTTTAVCILSVNIALSMVTFDT